MHALGEAGLDERVHVDSYGTAGWHVGRTMDERAAAVLTRDSYDATRHRARQIDPSIAETYDLVLAMDHSNATDLEAMGVPAERLRLFRDFDPTPGDGAVPDPYYGGDDGFADVLAMVERSAEGLARALQEEVVRA